MNKIHINPQEAWLFAQQKCTADAYDDVELASNEDFGVTITMYRDDDGVNIFVWMDDSLVDSAKVYSSGECEAVYDGFIEKYMTSKVFNAVDKPQEKELTTITPTMQNEIDLREEELTDATLDFVMAALTDDYDGEEDLTEICEKAKEAFLGYLGRRLDLPVYRPMLLEDDKGSFLSDYPYQDME